MIEFAPSQPLLIKLIETYLLLFFVCNKIDTSLFSRNNTLVTFSLDLHRFLFPIA